MQVCSSLLLHCIGQLTIARDTSQPPVFRACALGCFTCSSVVQWCASRGRHRLPRTTIQTLTDMNPVPDLPAALLHSIFGLLPRNDKACLKLLCKATRAAYSDHNTVHPGDGLLPVWLLERMWSDDLSQQQQKTFLASQAAAQDEAACIVNLAWLRAQCPPCAWDSRAGRAAAEAGNLQVCVRKGYGSVYVFAYC